jgi:glycosyltransferase involved in cell wall biosynthesis
MAILKIGFLLLHPFSESMASGVRTLELAKALRQIEIETIVFTPYEKTQIKDGLKVVNVPLPFSTLGIENQLYQATRRIYYSKALQRLVIKMSKRLATGRIKPPSKLLSILKEYDLDILQAEQDNAAFMLLSTQINRDIPLVLDLHGIWPEELLAASAIRENSNEWNELQEIMKYTVRNVDFTVCLSDAMKEYVLTNYEADPGRVTVVPPGGRVFCEQYSERTLPWKVVYAGIVSYRKHVDLFVRSMPYVKAKIPNVEFGITKKGDLLKRVQGMGRALGLEPNYFWFSNLTYTLKFLASCHVGVHPSANDTSARLSMPSKFFDYLSAGLPVVANDVGGWTEIIRKNNLGRVTSDNPKDFAGGILDLLDAPEEIVKCGQRGIDVIKRKYNWNTSAKLLAESYSKLASAL